MHSMALAPPYTFSACGTIHVLYVITMVFYPARPTKLNRCVCGTHSNQSEPANCFPGVRPDSTTLSDSQKSQSQQLTYSIITAPTPTMANTSTTPACTLPLALAAAFLFDPPVSVAVADGAPSVALASVFAGPVVAVKAPSDIWDLTVPM